MHLMISYSGLLVAHKETLRPLVVRIESGRG